MPFIIQGKTNLKYIIIVIILVAIVGIGIMFYWWQIKVGVENMPETQSLKKTEEPPKPLDTTGWKTYKSETYGFEFSYPANWYVKEEVGQFFLFDSAAVCQGACPTKKSNVSFGIENNNESLPVSEWIKQNVGTVGIETDAPFSVDGSQGIKRIYQGANGAAAIFVIFPQKDKLNALYYFETSGYENRRILDQILLDFHFLK